MKSVIDDSTCSVPLPPPQFHSIWYLVSGKSKLVTGGIFHVQKSLHDGEGDATPHPPPGSTKYTYYGYLRKQMLWAILLILYAVLCQAVVEMFLKMHHV